MPSTRREEEVMDELPQASLLDSIKGDCQRRAICVDSHGSHVKNTAMGTAIFFRKSAT